MLNQKIKNFWIEKINELKHRKGVASSLLTANEGNLDDTVWQKKINDLEKWEEIEDFALDICQDIYDKATVIDANDTWPTNFNDKMDKLAANSDGDSARDEYWTRLWKTLSYFEDFILKNYRKTAVDNLANRENQIKNALNRAPTDAIPNNWANEVGVVLRFAFNDLRIDPDNLPTIPVGEDLTTLLARVNHICPVATPCTLTHCPNTHANYNTIKGESDEYQRIQNKLNGKDLDTLINHTCSQCSHTDYDTLKQERDQLKTDQTTQEQAKQQAIQAKETEIITKIITDLQLSTERERENALEAVITEIKTKITPPTDNSADKQKITELETKIANLQAPKSLNDVKVSSEVKKEITKLSQDLGISNQTFTEELKSVDSYQQLASLQNKVFKEELSKETDSKNSAITLNYCLGALSLGSLLVLAYLLIKKTTSLPQKGDKKEKK